MYVHDEDARLGYMTKRRPTWIRVLVAAIVLGMTLSTAAVAVTAYSWTIARVDTVGRVDFEKPLQIPPLAASTVGPDGVRSFDLDMQSGTSDLGHGPDTETWGVNGSYLGPTIRAKRGETVRMNVSNRLGVSSTLHWHGMHLPAAMDGGPHQLVEPGTTWSPQWTVDQPAATLWYHPHMHGETADHVYRGIAGMFLIDDPAGAALPDRDGVDDVPVIVQDKKFNGERLDASSAIFNDTGVLGDEILVNGTPGPYLDVTTERVRLRLLNASNARVYNFGFSDDRDFQLIGTDGGYLRNRLRCKAFGSRPASGPRSLLHCHRVRRRSCAAHHPTSVPASGTIDSVAVLIPSTSCNCGQHRRLRPMPLFPKHFQPCPTSVTRPSPGVSTSRVRRR